MGYRRVPTTPEAQASLARTETLIREYRERQARGEPCVVIPFPVRYVPPPSDVEQTEGE